jgi:hypothetical protein
MMTFEQDGRRFNYRVASLCLEDGQFLLQGAEGEDCWTLPCGLLRLAPGTPI